MRRHRRRPALLALVGLTIAGAAVGQPSIPLLDGGVAGFVGLARQGPLDTPTLVTSHAGFVAVFGPADHTLANPHLAPSVAAYFANGGARLWIVRAASDADADLIGFDGGAPGARTGLQALRDVDEVAAVAIPGTTAPAVQAAMIAHATAMNDRMAILDPAATDDVAAVIARREGLGAPQGHAALYFPWVEAAPAGETVLLPPSGCVAGIYARTAPPEAPVGQILTATGVSYVVTDDDQAILNPLGINAIRAFPGEGVLVWGGRTLSSDPEWKYVPVRRMALVLEESIHEGTAWAVFEPNDEPLWAQLRIAVGGFLADRWAEGWFQGTSPDDAYFVRCDRTTMTQQDLDEGRTIILVGFAPLRPAEFLLLRIVHQRTDETAAPETPGRARPRLLDAAPNPFNPVTTVRFALPARTAVRLSVHDLRGRSLRLLVDGERLAAGPHARRWDGRDGDGRRLASGSYLLVLSADGATDSRRVTLIE